MTTPSPTIAMPVRPDAAEHLGTSERAVFVMEAPDGAAFRADIARHLADNRAAAPSAGTSPAGGASLGERMLGLTTEMASDVQQNHAIVSRALDKATRSGEPMDLMKAMMTLNDYQTRVQVITKVTSKAISALDQLTKLQ